MHLFKGYRRNTFHLLFRVPKGSTTVIQEDSHLQYQRLSLNMIQRSHHNLHCLHNQCTIAAECRLIQSTNSLFRMHFKGQENCTVFFFFPNTRLYSTEVLVSIPTRAQTTRSVQVLPLSPRVFINYSASLPSGSLALPVFTSLSLRDHMTHSCCQSS